MKIKINNIQRMTGDIFDWFEAELTLTDGATLKAFYDITEDEFRLFYAENLTWPERDSIRDQIMKVLCAMLAAECEDKD